MTARVETGPGWTLHLGDCLDPVTGLASLPDKGVDHFISDPPYSEHVHAASRRGVMRPEPGKGDAAFSRNRDLGFAALSGATRNGVAAQMARACRRWTLAFSDEESRHLWEAELTGQGMEHVRCGLWVKVGGTPQFTGDRPGIAHEAIEITHPPGRKSWNGGGRPAIWAIPIVLNRGGDSARVHTTQKPLALMEALVSDFTDPGELIADPFAGSGTTGVACIRLGRRFVGWEREPRYFDVAVKRLRAAREQLRMPLACEPLGKQASAVETPPCPRPPKDSKWMASAPLRCGEEG